MTALTAASKPFTAIRHELADIEKINDKVFTMNMVYTYALIEGYQSNGQTAYFSQELLSRRLGLTDRSVRNLLRDMVAMGLINKTGQIGGKTCRYTVNPITPEMVEPVEPTEAPQRAAKAPEEVQALNHTAEAVEAPTVVEIKPKEEAEAPEPAAPITLLDVYSGGAVSVVTPYPRGEVKEPSREWDLDPAF